MRMARIVGNSGRARERQARRRHVCGDHLLGAGHEQRVIGSPM
jgi:hypothetical protein